MVDVIIVMVARVVFFFFIKKKRRKPMSRSSIFLPLFYKFILVQKSLPFNFGNFLFVTFYTVLFFHLRSSNSFKISQNVYTLKSTSGLCRLNTPLISLSILSTHPYLDRTPLSLPLIFVLSIGQTYFKQSREEPGIFNLRKV